MARRVQTPLRTSVRLPRGSWTPAAHVGMAAESSARVNSAAEPDAVRVQDRPLPEVRDGAVALELPAASWTLVRLVEERG